jgi:nicotinamidase-related amidase
MKKGEKLKALIIMDMTNDFVFEKYEHEGKEYEGRLVAPLGKTIC